MTLLRKQLDLKARMKPGDVHLVVSHAKRTMKAYNHAGKHLWTIPALTEGVNGDEDVPGGDTPMGLYRLGQLTETMEGEPQSVWRAFGKFFVDLVEQENQEASRGRAGVGVHGGGSALLAPLLPRQTLTPTHGCVRVHNEDMERYVVPLAKAGGACYLSVVS